MKTKRKCLIFLALLFVCALLPCLVFTGCFDGGGDTDGGGTGETTVTALSVRINAGKKTTYYKGESFDASLTVLRAEYSDGSVRHFLPDREDGCVMTPAVFDAGDDSVTFTFGGRSATIDGITVVDAEVTNLTVSDKATGNSLPVGARGDFRDLIVTATFSNGDIVTVDPDYYTFTLDGVETDVRNFTINEAGVHTARINYIGVSSSEFTIRAYDGFVIEAENIYPTEDVRPNDRNYVELITDVGESGATTTGIAPGPVLSTDENGNMDEPASDGAYLGDIKKGAVFEFHIWSDVARDAHLILRASSGQILVPSSSNQWIPVEMADMNFSELFSISYGSAGSDTMTGLTTDAVLPGGRTDDTENGDQSLWVNWQDVDFGTIPLVEGDNVVRFEVTSNLVHNNNDRASAACNIDRLQIEYVGEEEA